MESRPRLLFVDDEQNIRVLIPAILKQHGFDVTAAATVAEALNLISTRKFDVLVSDLNIGEPGDGFTVVSAMRRTQPDAATFILTGYPAFDSALEAIRQQVDDYFVKPADAEALVSRILARLNRPPAQRTGIQAKRLPAILEEHRREIFTRWLDKAKADERIRSAGLSNEEMADHLPALIDEIIAASSDLGLSPDALAGARRHGSIRFQQGCSVITMIRETHILHGVLCRIVEENLLRANISFLVTDIMRIGEAVQSFLEESLHAFCEVQRAANHTEGAQEPPSVLLLSEDTELSLLRAYVLRKAGYSVSRASSRQDALNLLKSRCDALVISHSLPQESIREFAEHFRAENPNAPVIGIIKGSWQDLKIEMDGTANGENGPEVLLEAVAAALSRKRLHLIR